MTGPLSDHHSGSGSPNISNDRGSKGRPVVPHGGTPSAYWATTSMN
jgi:hypothetical protein